MPKGYRKDGTPIRPPNAGKGRQENKSTRDLKAMVFGALGAKGGQKWLEKQMSEYPAAFLGLLGRYVPIQNDLVVDGKLGIISDKPVTAEEWAAQVQADMGATEGPSEALGRLSS